MSQGSRKVMIVTGLNSITKLFGVLDEFICFANLLGLFKAIPSPSIRVFSQFIQERGVNLLFKLIVWESWRRAIDKGMNSWHCRDCHRRLACGWISRLRSLQNIFHDLFGGRNIEDAFYFRSSLLDEQGLFGIFRVVDFIKGHNHGNVLVRLTLLLNESEQVDLFLCIDTLSSIEHYHHAIKLIPVLGHVVLVFLLRSSFIQAWK